jgi:hypothetical protein
VGDLLAKAIERTGRRCRLGPQTLFHCGPGRRRSRTDGSPGCDLDHQLSEFGTACYELIELPTTH